MDLERGTEKLMNGLNDILSLKKLEATSGGGNKVDTLQYSSLWTNLDRMLKKLPESVVEDLNMQFISLAYNEIKKLESVSIIIVNQ